MSDKRKSLLQEQVKLHKDIITICGDDKKFAKKREKSESEISRIETELATL